MSASRQAKQAQFFLIGNPISGKKFLQQNWDKQVLPFLKTKLPPFDFGFTQKKGDATLLAKNALKKGYKTIVSMGGDGTLNEVLILQSSGQPILDQAALRIVRLAAPYSPFTGDLNEFDRLEIIRTWHFDRRDQLSSQ